MTTDLSHINFFEAEEPPTPHWQQQISHKEAITEKRTRVRNGETVPGVKKHPRPKYRRAELTDIDLRILCFLAIVRFASAAQVAGLIGVKNARGRLNGLQEFGVVLGSKEVPGKTLWLLTRKGLRIVKETFNLPDLEGTSSREPNLVNVAHTLAIGQVVSQLVTGVDACNRVKMTETFGTDVLPASVELLQIRSETFIERAHQQALHAHQGLDQGLKLQRHMLKAQSALEAGLAWRDLFQEFPALWVVRHEKQSHRPDFVIDNEPERTTSKPVSVAVEVELTHKSNDELAAVFAAYAADKIAYAAVIYVVQNNAIAKRVRDAAVKARFDRLHFAGLLGHDLQRFEGRAWNL